MKKWILVLTVLLGCSSVPKKTVDASTGIETEILANGAEIITLRDNAVPIIHLGLIVKQGASTDPMGQAGLTELMVNTWFENPEVSEGLAALGGNHSHDLTHDSMMVGGANLSEKKEEYLTLFFKLITKPKMTAKVFENKRQQALSTLQRISDDADLFAEVAFRKYLFGSHPYGRLVYGKPEDLKKLTFEQIKNRYGKMMAPSQMIFIAAGDFDDAFKESFKAKILELKGSSAADIHRPHPPTNKGLQILLIDKPDVTQAQIILGQFTVNKKNPDFEKINVAQTALGGSYSSRLNQRIRVSKGMTYDVHSELDSDLFESVLKISTSTKNETIEPVIYEILATVKDFVENGVTQDELDIAKNSLQGRLIRSVESPSSHVMWIAAQKFYGFPKQSVKDTVEEIKGISLGQVNDAIKKHISASNMKVVVVAPAKKVLKTLRKLGIVEVRHASDF